MESLHSLINMEPGKKEMICIVGAGGKTSVLFRLAGELSEKGGRVLVTTTTAIYYPGREQYDRIVVSQEETPDLFDNVDACGITVFGRSVSSEGKLLGSSPELLDAVFLQGIFDYIIVEGDGSKGRPIKAPASYEPVIPSRTGKLLGVIGMDCIGREVSQEIVHRPGLFCEITGCGEQAVISTETVSRLVLHEEGLFKTAPRGAERYLVLNKADREKQMEDARDIAKSLRDKGSALSGIIVSSFKKQSFRKAGGISGIILAAGLSRRMGTNKLLLDLGGVPVIERTIKAASESSLSEIILVCGSEIAKAAGDGCKVRIVHNAEPEQGQSRSIRLGVENASGYADGFMFLVGDQPYITAAIINKLIEGYNSGNYSAAVPLYSGKRGNPVIFSYSLKDKLMELRGDSGGRILLEGLEGRIAVVDAGDELSGFDIDTREEYEKLLKLEEKNG
ncbi:MAG TPA: selenium cofactor biosynthesis protein YqeC [Clostridia bacterium]|nr:selenium cofactor biosynthesis protein YqeC [Clostridia bacterium]